MATEKFIRGKHDDHNHDGRAAHRRRLEAANASLEFYSALPTHEILLYQKNGDNLPLDNNPIKRVQK